MAEPGKAMTFQELTELRRKTEAVSKFLQEQLAAHLETLRPVLSPERVFSKFLGTKGDHTLSDRAFAQLQQNYRPFSTRPFDIPSEFDPHWLTLVVYAVPSRKNSLVRRRAKPQSSVRARSPLMSQ